MVGGSWITSFPPSNAIPVWKTSKEHKRLCYKKNVWAFVKVLSALIWAENRIAKLICFEAALKEWSNWTDDWQRRNERAKGSRRTAVPSEGSLRKLYDWDLKRRRNREGERISEKAERWDVRYERREIDIDFMNPSWVC